MLKSGSKTIYTPINPVMIADHLPDTDFFHFKKTIARIETKNGQQKNNAFAVASVMYMLMKYKKKLKPKKKANNSNCC